jgi:recombination protein RecT
MTHQNQLVKKNPTALCATSVKNMLERHKDSIVKSLPRGFANPDRMIRGVINAISTTPELAKCTPESLFIAIVKGFSLGLEPNGLLGHGYLVPFNDNKDKDDQGKAKKKAQFMPGYRGLIDLARRSGEVAEIFATEVYENDFFEVSMGTKKELVHTPDMWIDRGPLKGFYAVFKLKDGSVDFEIMSLADIDKIRRLSKTQTNWDAHGYPKPAHDSPVGIWKDHFNEMARKTVIKKLLKRAPVSIDCGRAARDDDHAAMGENQDTDEVIDIVGEEVRENATDEPTDEQLDQLEKETETTSEETQIPNNGGA